MSFPAKVGWLKPTDPLTIKSDVIGDFHEPKGAIIRVFTNDFSSKWMDFMGTFLPNTSLKQASKNFCYNIEKALQDLCNLESCRAV
jgi:hypothetical protein